MCCCRVTTISTDWLINKQYSRDIQAYLLHTTTKIRHRASTSTRWHYAFALCCHSNETSPPIANPPKNEQLGSIPYHSHKLHPGPCSSVGMRRRTDRQTDTDTHRNTQTRVTNIPFASATPHAKCNRHSVVTGQQQIHRLKFYRIALRRNWFSQLHFHCSHQSTTDMIYLFPNFMKIYPFLFNPAEK